MLKEYRFILMSALVIVVVLISGCSGKKVEPVPAAQEDTIKEESAVGDVEVDDQDIPKDAISSLEEIVIEEDIAEDAAKVSDQVVPEDTISAVESPPEVEEVTIEEDVSEVSEQDTPDVLETSLPSETQKDKDGITTNSTSLSLLLNGVSSGNSLDYDADDRIDWWRIIVPTSGTLTIKSEPVSGLEIALYGLDGETLIADLSGGDDLGQVSVELTEAGTYYVKAYVDQPGNALSYTLNTSYTDANILYGFSSYDEGKYDECIEYLETALRSPWAARSSRSDILNAHLYLGIAYIAKNWEDKALEQFKEVLRISPGYNMNPTEFSPKIMNVFDEAKQTMSQ